MNKILRKCSDFGLIIRISDISASKALKCVRSLKKSDIPLCIVNSKIEGWQDILKEISTKEDLFIAAENISNIEDAYIAAGNGAQFFILSDSDKVLMTQLNNLGFFFIPRVSNSDEINLCKELNIECIFPSIENINKNTDFYTITESKNINNIEHNDNVLFTIIDLNDKVDDYEYWANNIVRSYLGLKFIEIEINRESSQKVITFGETFAAINKSKIIEGKENTVTLECKNFNRTISYLKWKNLFINPNEVTIVNNKLTKGHLDLKLGEYKIIIKERNL